MCAIISTFIIHRCNCRWTVFTASAVCSHTTDQLSYSDLFFLNSGFYLQLVACLYIFQSTCINTFLVNQIEFLPFKGHFKCTLWG